MHSAVRGRRVRLIRDGGGGSFMSLKDVHLEVGWSRRLWHLKLVSEEIDTSLTCISVAIPFVAGKRTAWKGHVPVLLGRKTLRFVSSDGVGTI